MFNKINIGIIGSNFASNVHLPAFKLNKHCNVVGISAKNFEKTKLIAKQHNIPNTYASWEELILDPNIDAISIAVPPWVQPNIILSVLEQKKAVFAEKPLAVNLTDAKQIEKLVKDYNLPNIINFSFAGCPAFIKAKSIFSNHDLNHKIDQIRYININWQLETKTSLDKDSTHWKTQEQFGGGVLFNFASHVLFYLEWLLYPAFIQLNTIITKKSNLLGDHLGNNLIQLSASLSTGAIVNIVISTVAFMGSGHKIEIYGNDASMILENPTNQIANGFTLKTATRTTNSWENIDLESSIDNKTDHRIMATSNLVNKFIDWITTGNTQNPNFTDGLRVNVLLDQIQKSSVIYTT